MSQRRAHRTVWLMAAILAIGAVVIGCGESEPSAKEWCAELPLEGISDGDGRVMTEDEIVAETATWGDHQFAEAATGIGGATPDEIRTEVRTISQLLRHFSFDTARPDSGELQDAIDVVSTYSAQNCS
ncbi:MAG: hypothetical protein GY788_05570 [bacterium]|nr:hypothetical protein [bacterium]